jgi:hypothetical protein
MGGNQNHHNQHYVRNDDPFAKVKFSIPPFNGLYDAKAYLDWEMAVEQKFRSHLVPEQYRVGHFQRDCSSKKSCIAIDDGGYVSASDVKNDYALQTNNTGDLDDDDTDVFGSEHTEEYNTKTYLVQRVLSGQVDTSKKLQRHNLFQIFFIIKDYRVRTINDGGSYNNLVSVDFMAKIDLTTRLHTHPYYIQWLNNSGKTNVIHTAHIHFSIDTYHDYANCDVVHM